MSTSYNDVPSLLSDNLSDFTDFIIHEMKKSEQDPNERNKLKTLDEDNFKFILFDLFLGNNYSVN